MSKSKCQRERESIEVYCSKHKREQKTMPSSFWICQTSLWENKEQEWSHRDRPLTEIPREMYSPSCASIEENSSNIYHYLLPSQYLQLFWLSLTKSETRRFVQADAAKALSVQSAQLLKPNRTLTETEFSAFNSEKWDTRKMTQEKWDTRWIWGMSSNPAWISAPPLKMLFSTAQMER